MPHLISADQCRAARALLGLEQTALAAAAFVSRTVIIDFESGHRRTLRNNLAAIRSALEVAGVEFIDANGGGAGVRLRQTAL